MTLKIPSEAKVSNPQAKEDNVKAVRYADLKSFSSEEYQSELARGDRRRTIIMKARMKKYIFDTMLTEISSAEETRSVNFDRITDDRHFAKLFFNIFHELNHQTLRRQDAPISGYSPYRVSKLECIEQICHLLGIESTIQINNKIDVSVFKAHDEELAKTLERLSTFGLSTRNKEKISLRTVSIKSHLSSMLNKEWCGRKLIGVGVRRNTPSSDGKRGKEYTEYELQGPEDIESLIKAVKRCDGSGGKYMSLGDIEKFFGSVAR